MRTGFYWRYYTHQIIDRVWAGDGWHMLIMLPHPIMLHWLASYCLNVHYCLSGIPTLKWGYASCVDWCIQIPINEYSPPSILWLQSINGVLEFPISLTISVPAQIPNWSIVADITSSLGRVRRSPLQVCVCVCTHAHTRLIPTYYMHAVSWTSNECCDSKRRWCCKGKFIVITPNTW